MNRYLLSLLCAGLAGATWADAPANPPPSAAAAPQGLCGCAAAPECGACCTPRVCVPVQTVKDKVKVLYDDRCVDYCLPRCSLFSLFSGCGEEGCLNCGSPRTKHVLIKKFVHQQCPEVKCEVQAAPCAP